jgi:1-acyl-sn-glycerol-3-phosphate acyltransferase
MQPIIVEKPYEFIPPYHGTWWSDFFRLFNFPAWQLRRTEGVDAYEIRHIERLKASLAAGHGILLTPNHPRTADPVAMGLLAMEAHCYLWSMASWHLFHQGWLTAFLMRRLGGFSVHREGVDRQAISTAVDLLVAARRPLVIFPEGATSRTNDKLQALLDGVAFIARSAAKKRAKLSPPGKVVVHPIAIKYLYRGDVRAAATAVLEDIERRLTWQPQEELPLLARIVKVGSALLSLKEIEYLGQPQTGTLAERISRLIDRLLGPIETQWMGGVQQGPVVPRVRNLRTKILPDMVAGRVTAAERARRWRQLADIYLAQQLACYPPDYLAARPSVDRVLEIVEKFEEDLFDHARVHRGRKVILEVGQAIEVAPERERGAPIDPLMVQIEQSLQQMLDRLALESPPFEDRTAPPQAADAPAASSAPLPSHP